MSEAVKERHTQFRQSW